MIYDERNKKLNALSYIAGGSIRNNQLLRLDPGCARLYKSMIDKVIHGFTVSKTANVVKHVIGNY